MARPTRLDEASDSIQEALKALETARRHLGAACVSLFAGVAPGAASDRARSLGSAVDGLAGRVADLADDVDALSGAED